MARFFMLIVLLLAAALANESSHMPEELAEFRQEVLKNLNKTNEMLYRLMRIVYEQPAEMRKLVEEQKEELVKFANATNDKLDQLAKNADQCHNQALERDRQIEEEERQRKALANVTERHIQLFPSHCNLVRSSNLTLLSNGKKYFFSKTPVMFGGFRRQTEEVKRTSVGRTGPNWSRTVRCGRNMRARRSTASPSIIGQREN